MIVLTVSPDRCLNSFLTLFFFLFKFRLGVEENVENHDFIFSFTKHHFSESRPRRVTIPGNCRPTREEEEGGS